MTENPFQIGQVSNPRSINQRHLISAKFEAVKDGLRNDLREYSERLHTPYLLFSNGMDSGFNSRERMHRSCSNICWMELSMNFVWNGHRKAPYISLRTTKDWKTLKNKEKQRKLVSILWDSEKANTSRMSHFISKFKMKLSIPYYIHLQSNL